MSGIFDPNIYDSGIFDTPTNTRTAADSLSTLTESPARVATYTRTVSDSISSISTSVSGIRVFPRTVADSLSSLTESVARAAMTQHRTAADSLSSLTEAVTRVWTGTRTASASLSSITEAVVATVSTIITRTVADSLSSITEAVTRVKTLNRTVADSISSIGTAVTRVATTARHLADTIAGIFEAVFSSGAPATPPSPPTPATFDLTVAGVSILYDPVMYEKAHFESQVNGVAGSCTFRVRDDDFSHSFTEGQEIVLTINSQTAWRGFITAIKRVYAFDAINVDQSGPTRFFDIEGADINTLLTKRIVFDQADGAHVEAPLLAPYTPDLTAIQELFADWLDLSGDGLDTTTLVQNVADTTWSQEGRAWEGSDTWAQAMQSIASLPAAIYYINPDKKFVYTDVDTANAPFKLSDQPDGVTSFGYSNMEVLKDGTSLANDVMCWGIGYGSQTPVFERVEDATSQAAHGLWQLGQTTFGVYKQDTVTRIADSIVYGSPQSKRGAKDDRVSVQCVTYQNGLRAGEKVDFTSNVFGFNDVIPIRKMEIDFPTPLQPKYTLTLSHEIDTPFSFFDNYWFNFNFPPFGTFTPPVLVTPGGCVCSITDAFDRTITSGTGADRWGIATALFPWFTSTQGGGTTSTFSVDGTAGYLTSNTANRSARASAGGQGTSLPIFPTPTDLYFDFEFSNIPPDASPKPLLEIQLGGDSQIRMQISPTTNPGYVVIQNTDEVLTTFEGFITVSGGKFSCHIRKEVIGSDTWWRAKIWPANTTEPSSWFVYDYRSGFTDPVSDVLNLELFQRGTNTNFTVAISNLRYFTNGTEVSNCTAVQFDNFERTVAPNGAGTATPSGYVWTTVTAGDNSVSVNGTQLVLAWTATSGLTIPEAKVNEVAGVPWQEPHWVMTTAVTIPSSRPSSSSDTYDLRLDTDGTGYLLLHLPTTGSTVHLSNDPGSPVAFTFNSGQKYFIKWDFTFNGPERVKVWRTSDAEPTSWLIDLANNSSGSPSLAGAWRMFFRLSTSSAFTSDIKFDSVNFTFDGQPCSPGGSPPGAGISANAWVCEQFDVVTTTLTLAHSYLANSPQVWKNGLLQPQSSYTQDAVAGTITFGSVPGPTDNARVCYWSLT